MFAKKRIARRDFWTTLEKRGSASDTLSPVCLPSTKEKAGF
jgi:hypothetical protein